MKRKYKKREEMIKKTQNLEGKTKINFRTPIRYYYDETNSLTGSENFHFEQDPFCKNAQI